MSNQKWEPRRTSKLSFEEKSIPKWTTSLSQRRQNASQKIEDIRLSNKIRLVSLQNEQVSQNVEKLHAELFYKKKQTQDN